MLKNIPSNHFAKTTDFKWTVIPFSWLSPSQERCDRIRCACICPQKQVHVQSLVAVTLTNFGCSRGRRPVMPDYSSCRFADSHRRKTEIRTQRQQRQMWFAVTSVAVGGTDWTAGQHQSTGLQCRTHTADWHTWRLQSSSQCSVWIHRGQDQQEQRLHLFYRPPAQAQTSLPVRRKSGRDRSKSTSNRRRRCW